MNCDLRIGSPQSAETAAQVAYLRVIRPVEDKVRATVLGLRKCPHRAGGFQRHRHVSPALFYRADKSYVREGTRTPNYHPAKSDTANDPMS